MFKQNNSGKISYTALSLGAFILVISITAIYLSNPDKEKKISASVVSALSETKNAENFAKADKPKTFNFPADSGPHNNFQTEWWYYTGNLEDTQKNHYGFQLTFFRRSLNSKLEKRDSTWGTNQIYFAHFTVTDSKNNKFYFTERYSRGAAKLSGAQAKPFHVWLENWSAKENGNSINIKAENYPVKIDLNTVSLKPVILQGDRGLSQKSSSNASYYYSQTRLKTEGSIFIGAEKFNVKGLSWLDREWSTSALAKDQTGWDWFSLQLDDKREIMLYQLRLKNGDIDNFSSGSLIDANGKLINLKKDDFKIKVLDYWKSENTEIKYPAKWQLDLPKYNISITVTPYINNQELNLSFTYWEGAVKVTGKNISGNGYVELTGYNEKAIK